MLPMKSNQKVASKLTEAKESRSKSRSFNSGPYWKWTVSH